MPGYSFILNVLIIVCSLGEGRWTRVLRALSGGYASALLREKARPRGACDETDKVQIVRMGAIAWSRKAGSERFRVVAGLEEDHHADDAHSALV